MKQKLKVLGFFSPLIIFIIMVLFFWRGLGLDPHAVPSALINTPTPGFNLNRLEQPGVKLNNKIFKGQVSLLNVWATWCVSCADEHPVLIDIAHSKVVPIYGLDYKDNRQDALSWLKRYGNPYRAIGFDHNGSVAINWGVYGTPETFIIDKEGKIRYKQIGPITTEVWQQKLLPIVKQLQRDS